jgi:hypothetical protein
MSRADDYNFISARFVDVRATRTFGRYPAHDIDDNDCRMRASARDRVFAQRTISSVSGA